MSKAEKTRASGTMTEAAFITFVKNQLRGASWKWKPTSDVLKKARIRKGWYLCNGCNKEVPASIVVDGKRVKNVSVDHIIPIVDPTRGFTTWDEFINRLYVEVDKLQCLCRECHNSKSKQERTIATERRKKKIESSKD